MAEMLCAAEAVEMRVSTSSDVRAKVSGFALLVSLGALIFVTNPVHGEGNIYGTR